MSRFFFLILTCFSLVFFNVNAADQDIYLVSGVPVSTFGKSPALAKSVAHTTARRDAFLILLTRLEMKINLMDVVTDDEISDMVRSEQIENEKISGNNYSAMFNIMFAKDFVEHILSQKDSLSTKVKIVEGSYILIPINMKKHRSILWGEDNDWKKAIVRTLDEKSLEKFIIPDFDIANVAALDGGNVLALDYATLEPVINRYKASVAYVLVFSHDEIENKVIIDTIRFNKFQKKQVRLSFVNVDRLSYNSLISKVADKTIDYLVNAQQVSSQGTNSNLTRIKIYLDSLNNWLAIKNKIENSGLVNQLNIDSISRDYFVVTVNYIGDGTIQETFADKGITLDQKSENYFTLDAN